MAGEERGKMGISEIYCAIYDNLEGLFISSVSL